MVRSSPVARSTARVLPLSRTGSADRGAFTCRETRVECAASPLIADNPLTPDSGRKSTRVRLADYLAGRGAHYLVTVKRNQPAVFAQLTGLPCGQVPVAAQTSERGHGRALKP